MNLPETPEELVVWVMEWSGQDFMVQFSLEHRDPHRVLVPWIARVYQFAPDAVHEQDIGLDCRIVTVAGIEVFIRV